MSSAQLVEKTRDLILTTIRNEIDAKLIQVSADRGDNLVSMEGPKSFFIYDGAHTYNCPAIFAVVDSIEFPDDQTGPNFVNGVVKLFVSAVIEDREADVLTIKAERYQAALFEILRWRTLEDVPKNVKIFSRVVRATFSPLYTKARVPEGEYGEFRKEVALELEVKHFENPN